MLTKVQSERLLAFTNNSGPLFIIGTVGITLFGNATIGILLFITHLLACLTVGILFRFWKYNPKSENKDISPVSNIEKKVPNLDILSSAITNSIHTVVLIGGFVVLFSVILSILTSSRIFIALSYLLAPIFHFLSIDIDFCIPFLSGIIELTNGVSQVASVMDKSISINIILCAFLLGFAGISVMLQVYAITAKSDLSFKPYIFGKLLHGIFAALYTQAIIKHIHFFNFDLEPVFINFSASHHTDLLSSYTNPYGLFILWILFCLWIVFLFQKKKINSYRNHESL